MEHLHEHECFRCKTTDEARFVLSGPHIKQVCNHCGAYVMFIKENLLPDVKTIRRKIWEVAKENNHLIETAKEELGFIPPAEEKFSRLIWWKLYMQVRITVENYEAWNK